MNCKGCFKIYTNSISDAEVDFIIDAIGINPGITDGCLYYNLCKVATDDDFILSVFVHVLLAKFIPKKDVLIDLKNNLEIQYELNISFSDMEEEVKQNRSFALNNDIVNFIKDINADYCFNKEYIDL